MSLKNGSNYYINNSLPIHQIKRYEENESKYLIVSYLNGKVALYERKS